MSSFGFSSDVTLTAFLFLCGQNLFTENTLAYKQSKQKFLRLAVFFFLLLTFKKLYMINLKIIES